MFILVSFYHNIGGATLTVAKLNVGQQSSLQVALILDHWIIGTVFLILHLLLKINASQAPFPPNKFQKIKGFQRSTTQIRFLSQ